MSANTDIIDLMQGQAEQQNELEQLRATVAEQAQKIDRIDADNRALIGEYKTLEDRYAEQARRLEEARRCITRRLRYHQNYPPVGSARWSDREVGIPGEDARDCDCDYCIEDRAWLAANPAPAPQAEQEQTK